MSSKKKRSWPKTFAKFSKTAGNPQKKRLRLVIRKFSTKLVRQKIFFAGIWRAPRPNYIAHDLRTFSTSLKIVLFSSWEQGILEDLQGAMPRPKTWPSRPKTLNCVLEDVLKAKNVLEDSTSGHKYCFFLPMSQLLHCQSQYSCMQL